MVSLHTIFFGGYTMFVDLFKKAIFSYHLIGSFMLLRQYKFGHFERNLGVNGKEYILLKFA